MPRYFFDLVEGESVDADEDGVLLADIDAAKDAAMELGVRVAADRMPNTSDLSVTVRSGEGSLAWVNVKITVELILAKASPS